MKRMLMVVSILQGLISNSLASQNVAPNDFISHVVAHSLFDNVESKEEALSLTRDFSTIVAAFFKDDDLARDWDASVIIGLRDGGEKKAIKKVTIIRLEKRSLARVVISQGEGKDEVDSTRVYYLSPSSNSWLIDDVLYLENGLTFRQIVSHDMMCAATTKPSSEDRTQCQISQFNQ